MYKTYGPAQFTEPARFVQDLMFINMRKHDKFALKLKKATIFSPF